MFLVSFCSQFHYRSKLEGATWLEGEASVHLCIEKAYIHFLGWGGGAIAPLALLLYLPLKADHITTK